MMAGAKAVDYDHKEKGIEQTWNSMTKTCTPIIYSQPFTESDMEQKENGEEGEKGTSDDEPDDSTLASVMTI